VYLFRSCIKCPIYFYFNIHKVCYILYSGYAFEKHQSAVALNINMDAMFYILVMHRNISLLYILMSIRAAIFYTLVKHRNISLLLFLMSIRAAIFYTLVKHRNISLLLSFNVIKGCTSLYSGYA